MFDEAAAKELLAVVRLRVKRLRGERDLSQEEVADRVPMDVRTLQRFEASDFEETDPQIRTFMKVAYGLGIDLHDLLSPPTDEERRHLNRPAKKEPA